MSGILTTVYIAGASRDTNNVSRNNQEGRLVCCIEQAIALLVSYNHGTECDKGQLAKSLPLVKVPPQYGEPVKPLKTPPLSSAIGPYAHVDTLQSASRSDLTDCRLRASL